MKKNVQLRPVFVVEGRDDTRRLRAVDPTCQTVETVGSSVPKTVLERLVQLEALGHPIVIVTDPDVQGERIRRLVAQRLKTPIHLHITRAEGQPTKSKDKSLGVEHAPDSAIKRLLATAEQMVQNSQDPLKEEAVWTNQQVRELGLVGQANSRHLRELLGESLAIGYVNGKHLTERLNLHQVTRQQVQEILDKAEGLDAQASES